MEREDTFLRNLTLPDLHTVKLNRMFSHRELLVESSSSGRSIDRLGVGVFPFPHFGRGIVFSGGRFPMASPSTHGECSCFRTEKMRRGQRMGDAK